MTEAHSMSCEKIEPLLSAYVLEELEGVERSDVTAHIATCEKCREESTLLSSTAALVSKSTPAESQLGPTERGKILAAAQTPRAARKYLLRWAGALAAAALVIVGVAVFLGAPALRDDKKKASDELLARSEVAMAPAAAPAPVRLEREARVEAQTASVERTESLVAVPATSDALEQMREASGEARDLASNAPGITRDKSANDWDFVAAGKPVELALAKVANKPADRAFFNSNAIGAERGIEEVKEKEKTGDFGLAPKAGGDGVVDAGSPPETREVLLKRTKERVEKSQPSKSGGRQSVSEGLTADKNGLVERKSVASGLSSVSKRKSSVLELAQAGGEAKEAEAPGIFQRITSDSVVSPAALPAPTLSKPPPYLAGGVAAPAPTPVRAESVPGATAPAKDYKARVDDFLTRLDRKPGETPDMMFFRYWGDNPFVEASSDSLSTFAVDVDTASYTLTRSYLYKQGVLPPREAIRTEEFINYFKGRYDPPATDEGPVFAIHTEIAASPFAHEAEYKLLRVGIKGKEVSREKRKACSLVFVVDTSGSMRRENRLELVKDALRLLVKELDEGDTIGVVAFDREARTILEPAPVSEKERILDAIATLQPRSNTNVAAGLDLGYQMAGSRFLKDGSNRVILLSDGVANTGILDVNTMLEQIRSQRERGVYLTTVGVGMGNLNDTLLEQLADRGNGQCIYVDRVEEAKKAFVDNLVGTLETIARDVKIQVELDPAKVLRYRLLGYENRAIADSAFRDNSVDAGEVGAGHEVTALYELKLKPDAAGSPPAGGKIATVRVRYLTVDHGEAQELEKAVDSSAANTAFSEASPRFRLHACVAEFAEVLRDSYWARGSSLDRVASMLTDILDLREKEGGPRIGEDQDVVELVALVKKADALVRRRTAEADDVARAVDAIKDNLYLSARVEDEIRTRGEQNRSQLDEIRRQNDDLRRKLESLLAR